MQRCIELAQKGAGWVAPNPMVGCVIVKNDRVIAEGYHKRFGGAHAETYALRRAGNKARGATLYVNLEPCAHHGKTPPCVDAIIAAGVRSIVVATRDPNPWVVGRGVQKLRNASIRVTLGILKNEAERLNEKFFTFMKKGLPFVGVKVAQTLDGIIADAHGHSQWITGEQARKRGHKLRSEYDAVLVGATTVLRDNPKLTVRLVKGRNPVRVVLDGRLSAPVGSQIFQTGSARTMVLTSTRAMREQSRKVQHLSKKGVQVIPIGNSYVLSALNALVVLARLNISSVLVEGGSSTIGAFIEKSLVDKVHCFVSPRIFGGGLHAWKLESPRPLSKSKVFSKLQLSRVGEDFLIEGRISQL